VVPHHIILDLAKRGFGLGFPFLYPPTGNPTRVLAFMNPPMGSWRVPMGYPKKPKNMDKLCISLISHQFYFPYFILVTSLGVCYAQIPPARSENIYLMYHSIFPTTVFLHLKGSITISIYL
jgi:hypothetical protein